MLSVTGFVSCGCFVLFCFVFEYFLQESDLSKNLTIIASVRESLEIILNQFISGKDVCWF